MESRNLAIAVLSITAVILFISLVVVNTASSPAVASTVSTYGGDFTISVGRLTRDTELVYVIDNTTQRLLIYGIDRKSGACAILDKYELAQAARQGTPP